MRRKPNVILITTDQQRKDSLGCYGSDFVNTPNLDDMARNGAVFNRAYCTSPVCTPSRASIYSGRYVSHHGAWNVGTHISEVEMLLPHIFGNNGYRTHHIGKAHFQPYTSSPEQSIESRMEGWNQSFAYYGFDNVELCLGHSLWGLKGHYGHWVKEQTGQTAFAIHSKSSSKFGGEAYDWDIPAQYHNSKWTAKRAVEFLEEAYDQGEPFFLSIGFQDPHHPHALPTERTGNMRPECMPLPNFVEGELDDKPAHFNAIHRGEWDEQHAMHGKFPMAGQAKDGGDYRKVSREDTAMARAYYYGMVELIDEAMGDILAEVRQRGQEENTIIIFTSDHGELLGDHGIWMKGPFHYEELINIPLIIQWKGFCKPNLPVNSIVSLVDLAPTILALCGVERPMAMDGVDISCLLQQNQTPIRDHALVEHVDDPNKIRLKTIVGERYKLTCYYGDYGNEYGELYDLHEDPHETRNLWKDAKSKDIKIELLMKLIHELEKIESRQERISYA